MAAGDGLLALFRNKRNHTLSRSPSIWSILTTNWLLEVGALCVRPQAVIGLIGQGHIQIHHIRCNSIDSVARDYVAGERQACIRIRDDLRGQQSRKVSVPLGGCQWVCNGQVLLMDSKPFIGHKEKGSILAVVFRKKDRPSEIASELILAQNGFLRPGRRECVGASKASLRRYSQAAPWN